MLTTFNSNISFDNMCNITYYMVSDLGPCWHSCIHY